jgi:hypothetical protein
LSAPFLSHACPLLSLSHRPHLSDRPQPPAHIPPLWTRPRPRDLRPPPHILAHFEPHAPLAHFPLLTCALSRTLSPPLSLCARDQVALPPLTEDHRSFCDRRRARAPSVASVSSASPSATRDTLRFAFSIPGLPGPRSPEHFLRSRSPPPSTQGSPHPHRPLSAPEFALEARNLPVPLIRPLLPFGPCNSSPELIRIVVSPPRRVTRSLVLLCQRGAHGRVRQIALSALELYTPNPYSLAVVVPLVSGEPSPRDRAALPHPRPTASRWISGVHPRSGGLDLIRVDLISALRSRSDCSPLSPSPVPLPLGPAGQPALVH